MFLTILIFRSFCCHVATLIDRQYVTGGNKGGNRGVNISASDTNQPILSPPLWEFDTISLGRNSPLSPRLSIVVSSFLLCSGSATSSLLSASVARRKRRRSEGEAKEKRRRSEERTGNERETNGDRSRTDTGEDVVFSKVCCCKDSYHTSFLNWMKPIIIRYLYIF